MRLSVFKFCPFLALGEVTIGADDFEDFDDDNFDNFASVTAHCNVSATVCPRITLSSSLADNRHAAITFVFVFEQSEKDRKNSKGKQSKVVLEDRL